MAEGAEPKTSFAPFSGRSRFLDPETIATWKAKRRVRSQRLKSVTDFYEEPEARNRSSGAARGAGSHARWSQPGSEFHVGGLMSVSGTKQTFTGVLGLLIERQTCCCVSQPSCG